jgi:SSS family solute:Na+ symporter/sodium/pantothenate symporter
MSDPLQASNYGPLVALVVFLAASVWLGTLAQRALARGPFLQSYFLGNRGLGAWAVALTATVQSGGTFMGYPSLVYSYGWVVALWIASYMVVPITGFGIVAKRLAQLSRRTGAITVPDLFRERFNSPTAGLLSSLLIMFFMSFMMVAQFKAGASIMKVVWPAAATSAAVTSAGVTSAGVTSAGVTSAGVTSAGAAAAVQASSVDWLFLGGLAIFAVTVVGYTMIGGFLAAVWTDLFQSVLMWVGVMILLCLTLWQVGGVEAATRGAVANTSPEFALGPGYSPDGRQFLTPGLALSMFFVWVFGGIGSAATLVRLMACKDTQTIRRSIVLLGVYNLMIYLPLAVICIGARAVMLNLGEFSDEVVPRMALWMTRNLPGGPLVAGLVLVAPFGAVMATVSAFLVVIASGIVRDVYQRFVRPEATAAELRSITYAVMAGVGVFAVIANLRPVAYLQVLIVFCTSSGAAAFVVPGLMAAFWRRATAAGTIAAMLAGAGTASALLLLGGMMADPKIGPATAFRSYYVLGLEPVVWGLLASLTAGVFVSLCTTPPDAALVSRLFDAHPMQNDERRS